MGKYKIGELSIQSDNNRPDGIRIFEMTKDGLKDARRVNYLKYHKKEDISNCRILQLDMNPFNFKKSNLVKVTIKEMNLLLNNRMLSCTDNYKFNKKINKIAVNTIKLMIESKNIEKRLKNEV